MLYGDWEGSINYFKGSTGSTIVIILIVSERQGKGSREKGLGGAMMLPRGNWEAEVRIKYSFHVCVYGDLLSN